MRSRGANAATARAFSLVIQPDFDRGRAALVLADTSPAAALSEAVAHLQPSLFEDQERISADAAEVLSMALARRLAAA